MLFINEWLPNPIGSDAAGEFIELWNQGPAVMNLGGWVLRTDNKKQFHLSGRIASGEYMVLPRARTKLALKNSDGQLFLYDPAGNLADRSFFLGTAPEGESFNRVAGFVPDVADAARGLQRFAWGAPTPGAKNRIVMNAGISENFYPFGTPLASVRPEIFSWIGLSLLAGVIFAAALWYAIIKDENGAQFFSGRDQSVRR